MRQRNVLAMLAAAILWLAAGSALAQEAGLERSEPNGCAGCHINPGMAETVDQWLVSEHGRSFDDGNGANTYCAQCKAPPVWDPEATYADNDTVPVEEWPDVTCSGCHPPHHLRVEWGTPTGIMVDPTAEHDEDVWVPIYDNNLLCMHCHSGERHGKTFQGFGQVMFYHKGVTCVDCHMAEVPHSSPDGWGETHTFTVADNLPYSCGVGNDSCHPNKTSEWAWKQMEKSKIHGKK